MRHIEKLKEIFEACGKECSKNTNGEALNELVTMAKNGELSKGGYGQNLFFCWTKISESKVKFNVCWDPSRIDMFKNGYYGCLIIENPTNYSTPFNDTDLNGDGFKSFTTSTNIRIKVRLDYCVRPNPNWEDHLNLSFNDDGWVDLTDVSIGDSGFAVIAF